MTDDSAMTWRKIETAPRDGTWFLGYWPVHTYEDRIKVTQWPDFAPSDDEARFVDNADSCDWKQPTHWMPLPPPPASEGE